MGLSHSPKVISDGLVLYLDATNTRSYSGTGSSWYDLSVYGNNSTLISSPTFINNKYGQLAFNGSTQYATVPHTSTLWNGQTFTLSVWAKKTGTGNAGVSAIMISKDTNYLEHSYNGKTMASFRNSANAQFLLYGNTSASYNEWRHYAVTYDGTMGVLYENGAATGSTTLAITVSSTSNPLNIGRWDGTSYNLNGCIAGAMVYNRALNADEILQNYNSTKYKYILKENIITDGLLLHYDMSNYQSAPFTGASLTDLSGIGNTGTLVNGPTYSSVAGGSLSFDGTNDHLTSTLDLRRDFTLSCWVYQNSTEFAFFGLGDPATNAALHIVNTNGYLRFGMYYNDTDTSGVSFSTNTWYNYVFTYMHTSPYTKKIYRNGQQLNTVNAGVNQFTGTGTFRIGALWSTAASSHYANGLISQVLVYGKVLSEQEILQNYNASKTRFGIS